MRIIGAARVAAAMIVMSYAVRVPEMHEHGGAGTECAAASAIGTCGFFFNRIAKAIKACALSARAAHVESKSISILA